MTLAAGTRFGRYQIHARIGAGTSPRLTIATPRRLFEKHYEPSISLYANYSTIDGQRFVMVKRLDQRDAPVRIDVTVNWFEQLKRATQ